LGKKEHIEILKSHFEIQAMFVLSAVGFFTIFNFLQTLTGTTGLSPH
jgi:hypothetical protein